MRKPQVISDLADATMVESRDDSGTVETFVGAREPCRAGSPIFWGRTMF